MVGESARKTWQAQTCSAGELRASGGEPCPGGLQLPPLDEPLTHPEGGWGYAIRVDHVQSLYCGSGRQELWSEGHRYLLWWQPKNPVVDTEGQGSRQAEEGGLPGLAGPEVSK